MAKGMPNAMAVLAVAERGAMFDPSAVFYMEKLAVGPEAADVIDITAPVAENIRRVAKAKRIDVADVTVCVLDRPRHSDLVEEIRRDRRPDPVHLRRRRRRRDLGGPAEHRRRHALRHRRHPGGDHRGVPRSSAWAARSRAGSGRRDDEEREGHRRGASDSVQYAGCVEAVAHD